MKNFFMLYPHQFPSESVNILVPNLDLPSDIENFQVLIKLSDSGNTW